MFSVLAATLLLGAPAVQPAVALQPAGKVALKKELFADKDWYKRQPGKEQQFTGILKKTKRLGGIGFGRFNPYRLEMTTKGGKIDVREVYIGGKFDWLTPYVGVKVKITGKAVNMGVEGRFHREIWPARLQVVAGGGKVGKGGKQLKIIAKGRWPYVSANPRGPRQGKQYVIRSVKELAKLPPWSRLRAAQFVVERKALADTARALKVKTIDFDKQMVLIITAGVRNTGGYTMQVHSTAIKNGKLTVEYSVRPPRGFATQAFTHPAIVVLVERFNGPVQFQLKRVSGVRPGLGRGGFRPQPRIDR